MIRHRRQTYSAQGRPAVRLGKSLHVASKPASSLLFKGAVVAFCSLGVASTVFTWQGGAFFDADFLWSQSSYSAEKAYESEAYQIKEEDKADNQLSESEVTEQDDSVQNQVSLGGPNSQTRPVITDEVVSSTGSGGTGNGGGELPGPGSTGRPSGALDTGQQTDGEGNYIPNPDRIRAPENDPALQKAGANKLLSLALGGTPKVKKGTVSRSDILPFLTRQAEVALGGDPDNTIDYSRQLKDSSFNFGKGIDANGTATNTVSFTTVDRTGIQTIPIYYNENYLTFLTTVTVQAYENAVTFEDKDGTKLSPPGSQNAQLFFDGSHFEIPKEVWGYAIDRAQVEYHEDGSMKSIFPGFKRGNTFAGSYVRAGDAQVVLMVPATATPVDENLVIKREGSDQVFEGTRTPDSLANGVLRIPDGVTRVSIDDAVVDRSVKTIMIPSSVKSIDIPSVLKAFPHLEAWIVDGNNFVYRSTGDEKSGGLLQKKIDLNADATASVDEQDANWQIVSIPAGAAKGDIITIPAGTRSFDKDVFAAFTSERLERMKLKFESERPELEDATWLAIPRGMKIVVPSAITDPTTNQPVESDIPFFRYLSVLAPNNLQSKLDATSEQQGKYSSDSHGFVYSADSDVLHYVPASIRGTFEISWSVDTIACDAFCDADGISSVTIPEQVTTIEQNAFRGAISIESIVVEASEGKSLPSSSAASIFGTAGLPNGDLVVYLNCTQENHEEDASYRAWRNQVAQCVASGSGVSGEDIEAEVDRHIRHFSAAADGQAVVDGVTGAVYCEHAQGSANASVELVRVPTGTTAFIFRTDTTSIGSGAIVGCDSLKVIDVPDGVSTIASDAIEGCAKLEVLYLPAALEPAIASGGRFGATSEAGCPNVKAVCSRAMVSRVNEHEFYNVAEGQLVALVSDFEGELDLPSHVKSIAAYAARGCTALEKISPRPLSSIGDEAFVGCTSLSELTVIGQDLALGTRSFAECTGLENLTVGGRVALLGSEAFDGCSALVEATLGGSGSSIKDTGTATFVGCKRLSTVHFDGAIGQISDGSFAGCTALTEVDFSSAARASVKRVGDCAFIACDKLKSFPFYSLFALESIGEYSFAGTSQVLELYAPASLRTVGASAFVSLSADEGLPERLSNRLPAVSQTLPSSSLPAGLRSVRTVSNARLASIEPQAFSGCQSLTSLDLSQVTGALTIKAGAFEGCSSLASVDLPSSLASLGERAFAHCSSMQVVRGNLNRLASVGSAAFAHCTALTTISLASSQVGELAQDVFAQCSALRNVDLPATLRTIRAGAFADCTSLARITLQGDSVTSVAGGPFGAAGEKSDLPRHVVVVVPQRLLDAYRSNASWIAAMTADDGVFYRQNIVSGGTGTVTIMGATYKTVQDKTGKTETHLQSVDTSAVNAGFEIQPNTTHIDEGAFRDCTAIKTLIVPASVKFIGKDALAGCTSLENLVFEGDYAPELEGDLFGATQPNANYRIFCPTATGKGFDGIAELQNDRKPIECGDSFSRDAASGALYSDYESSGIHMLIRVPKSYEGDLTLDASTNWIADYAAQDCTGLTSVDMRNNVRKIAVYAFAGCTSLEYVPLANTTTQRLNSIGESAFEGCTSLRSTVSRTSTSLRIPVSTDSIDRRAFAGCSAVASVSIQGQVTQLPEQAFAGCTSLQSVGGSATFVSGLRSIGRECYLGCTNFTTSAASLTSFTSLTSIGAGAYRNCTKLALVTLPASLTSIGADAFAGDANIEIVAFNGSTPMSLAGTGLDVCFSRARFFVPSGTKDAYLSKWTQAGLGSPARFNESASSYRAISGNLYTEDAGQHLTFLAATSRAIASASINGTKMRCLTAYNGAGLASVAIGEEALMGMQGFAGFKAGANLEVVGARAFKDSSLRAIDFTGTGDAANPETSLRINAQAFENCTALSSIKLRKNTTFIGTGAFANVSSQFVLDASNMTSAPTLDERIFGDAIPVGCTIELRRDEANPALFDALAAEWGEILVRDYRLSAEELRALIVGLDEQAAADIVERVYPSSAEAEVARPADADEEAADAAVEPGEAGADKPAGDETADTADDSEAPADDATIPGREGPDAVALAGSEASARAAETYNGTNDDQVRYE